MLVSDICTLFIYISDLILGDNRLFTADIGDHLMS
jgi:hypothetical protein